MKWSGGPAASRRALMIVGLAALVCAGSNVRAQQQAGQAGAQGQQAAAPQQPPDPFVFATDETVMVFLTVAPATAPDFEATMAKVKETLAASDNAERKQQAAHWKVTKTDETPNGIIYVMTLDPAVKGASYNPFLILRESKMTPADVQALYDKVSVGLKGINVMTLHSVVDMTGGMAGGIH
jgi:hypothetical protein